MLCLFPFKDESAIKQWVTAATHLEHRKTVSAKCFKIENVVIYRELLHRKLRAQC